MGREGERTGRKSHGGASALKWFAPLSCLKSDQSDSDAENHPGRYSGEDGQQRHDLLGEGRLVQRINVRRDGEELIRGGRFE
jgi:hypothetical protein